MRKQVLRSPSLQRSEGGGLDAAPRLRRVDRSGAGQDQTSGVPSILQLPGGEPLRNTYDQQQYYNSKIYSLPREYRGTATTSPANVNFSIQAKRFWIKNMDASDVIYVAFGGSPANKNSEQSIEVLPGEETPWIDLPGVSVCSIVTKNGNAKYKIRVQ